MALGLCYVLSSLRFYFELVLFHIQNLIQCLQENNVMCW